MARFTTLVSKGANAVFFNPAGAAIGGALLNIQGIPAAATGTYTLLCDGSATGSVYSMSENVPIPPTRLKTWLYQTLLFNAVTGESIFGPETEYVQDQMVPDPEPADFLPPLPNPGYSWSASWRIGWKQTKYTNTGSTTLITGYAFDSADALQAVLHAHVSIYAYTDTPAAGNEYAFNPPFARVGDGRSYTQYTKIGTSTGLSTSGGGVRRFPVLLLFPPSYFLFPPSPIFYLWGHSTFAAVANLLPCQIVLENAMLEPHR